MSEDISDGEEEILVYAAFDDNDVNVNNRSIHVLGINESRPIIQMDETFFMGKFENTLGTYMFFEEDLNAQSADPLLDRLSDKNLKYVSKTNKLLVMKQACVTAKEEHEIPSQSSEKDTEIEAISFSKLEDALEKFKNELKLSETEVDKKPCIPNSKTD